MLFILVMTGKAVEKACIELKENLCAIAAQILDCDPSELEFRGDGAYKLDGSAFVSRRDIATKSMAGNSVPAQVTVTHTSQVSPPPFMAGMVEIELDRETGSVTVLDACAVVDCGRPINPNLARIQAEGGMVQAIGMTLSEGVTYTAEGRLIEDSFLQYKIPTRLDVGRLLVEFEDSHEPTGPYGAKSIGEVVINTTAPAITHAIFRATGVWHRSLPVTPEKILMAMES